MDLLQLNKELLEKDLSKFYCFTGVEREVINIYIKKIVEISGKKQINVDKLSDIFDSLDSSNILNLNYVYVITNDADFIKKEPIWNKVINDGFQGDNIIIMVYFSIDKRSKFYGGYKDHIFEFDKMSAEVLARQIKKEIGLNFSLAEDLAVRCDCLYGVVLLECDKLNIYSKVLNKDIDEVYKLAVQQKLVYTNPSDVIFEFIEAVCKKEAQKSFNLYEDIKYKIESPLQVIALLYNNFRNILLVQSSATSSSISTVTGLNEWLIGKTKQIMGRYELDELISCLRLLQRVEQGIKTGQIESDIALEYFLVRIL
jgi:DNA polymerase III delta subunit